MNFHSNKCWASVSRRPFTAPRLHHLCRNVFEAAHILVDWLIIEHACQIFLLLLLLVIFSIADDVWVLCFVEGTSSTLVAILVFCRLLRARLLFRLRLFRLFFLVHFLILIESAQELDFLSLSILRHWLGTLLKQVDGAARFL